MKKRSFLTLAAALLLAVSLAACGGGTTTTEEPEDSIVGDWQATISMADELNEAFAEDEEFSEFFGDIEKFDMTLGLSFAEDGNYTFEIDKDALVAEFQNLKEPLEAGFRAYMESMIAEMGLEMTVDEMMEESGITIDDLMAELNAEDFVDMEEWNASGTYKLDGDKLYLGDGDAYENISLAGDTLTIESPSEDADGQFTDLYPITFQRAG